MYEYEKLLENYEFILNNFIKFNLNDLNIDNNVVNELISSNYNTPFFELKFGQFEKNATNFDLIWYKNKYLSENDNIDPIAHYLKYGANEGYNPNPYFDTKWYLKDNPDVKNNGINPFIHYLKFGIFEGRLPKLISLDELDNLNLKRSLKGRGNFLFLINDYNQEIKQHFSKNYNTQFNKEKFIDSYYYKKELFNENNIEYYYFIVPDKSIICKEFLPFEWDFIRRNIDELDFIPDFSNDLNHECYYKYDSHMNYLGGEKLSYKILNFIDNQFKLDKFQELLDEGTTINCRYGNDLLSSKNSSYYIDELPFEVMINVSIKKPKLIINLEHEIPSEYLYCKKRKSYYYKNKNSFSNKRVLIFHDSSILSVKWYLTFYFREIFFFWDHGNLNKEVINWYKPDIILEIRIERFIENLITPKWIEMKEKL